MPRPYSHHSMVEFKQTININKIGPERGINYLCGQHFLTIIDVA